VKVHISSIPNDQLEVEKRIDNVLTHLHYLQFIYTQFTTAGKIFCTIAV